MPAFEYRLYRVAEGEMETLNGILRDLCLPMLADYGIKPIGFWQEAGASILHYVVEHEDVASIEGNWDRFHADPRWGPGLAEREGGRIVVLDVMSVPLNAIPGLPPHTS